MLWRGRAALVFVALICGGGQPGEGQYTAHRWCDQGSGSYCCDNDNANPVEYRCNHAANTRGCWPQAEMNRNSQCEERNNCPREGQPLGSSCSPNDNGGRRRRRRRRRSTQERGATCDNCARSGCPPGQYASRSSNDGPNNQRGNGCTNCPRGRWVGVFQTLNPGQNVPGSAARCSGACPAGRSTPENGEPNCFASQRLVAAISSAHALSCLCFAAQDKRTTTGKPNAEFRPRKVVGKRSKVNVGHSCQNCPAGRRSTAGSTCQECGNGKYAPAGSASCINCPAGQYDRTDNTACNDCPAGKYSPNAGQDSSNDCRNCQSGRYSVAGASACISCAAGSSANSAGTDCAECPAGRRSTAGSTCQECGNGKYAPAGSASCINCPAGQYDRTDNTACNDCPAGKYSPNAGQDSSNDCRVCQSGKYQGAVGQASCILCAAGQIDTGSRQQCQDCPAGKSTRNAAGNAMQAGDTVSTNRDHYDNNNDCRPCGAGRYAPAGELCAVCGLSTYSAATAVANCINCPTGQIAAGDSADSHDDQSDCAGCPPGEELSGTVCTGCGSGKYSDTGEACALCAAGQIDTDNRQTCQDCPAGKSTRNAAGNAMQAGDTASTNRDHYDDNADCRPCGAGRYAPAGELCAVCGPGTYSAATAVANCINCDPGQGGGNGAASSANECVACSVGQHSAVGSACAPCGSGLYASTEGQASCTPCMCGSEPNAAGTSCVGLADAPSTPPLATEAGGDHVWSNSFFEVPVDIVHNDFRLTSIPPGSHPAVRDNARWSAHNGFQASRDTASVSADINGDGYPDLFVASLDSNKLLLGQGTGRFVDAVTPGNDMSTCTSFSAAIADGCVASEPATIQAGRNVVAQFNPVVSSTRDFRPRKSFGSGRVLSVGWTTDVLLCSGGRLSERRCGGRPRHQRRLAGSAADGPRQLRRQHWRTTSREQRRHG